MSSQRFADPRGLAQRLMESKALVAIYESRLWRRNPVVEWAFGLSFDDEVETIVAATGVEDASLVLDLACGSGIYTRRLAKRLRRGRIVGLDLSVPMLAYAARAARRESLGDLSFLRGSALDLPFAASRFDVVVCCGALHLFPDVPRALRAIRRVLKPGGRFAAAIIRASESARGRRVVEWRKKRLGVYSFGRGEIQQQLADAGFSDVEVLHEGSVWMIVAATFCGESVEGGSTS